MDERPTGEAVMEPELIAIAKRMAARVTVVARLSPAYTRRQELRDLGLSFGDIAAREGTSRQAVEQSLVREPWRIVRILDHWEPAKDGQ